MHWPLFNLTMAGSAFLRCASPSQSSCHLFRLEPDRPRAMNDLWRRQFVAGQNIVMDKLRHRQMHAVMPRHDDETTETGWLL